MIRSAASAEKEEATHHLRTTLIVMGHGQPLESSRQLKTIGRQPFHTHVRLKQATSQGLGLDRSSIHLPPCGGHKQLIQVGAAKTTGGDLTARQRQPFEQQTAGRIPTRHSPTTKQGDPKHALRIDAHAIWNGIPILWNGDARDGFTREVTRGRERKGQNLPCRRVNEIKGSTVLAPSQAVGNRQPMR